MTMRNVALLLMLTVPALGAAAYPALSIRVASPPVLDGELRGVWRVTLTNSSSTAMAAVPLSLSAYIFHVEQPFVAFPDGSNCTIIYSGEARCTVDVPANGSRELVFPLQQFTRYGHGSLRADATSPVDNMVVSDTDNAVFGRPYLVTNTDDGGPGSLRQAILDVNRDCAAGGDPCAIQFAIARPVPAEGWFTISPRMPLPPVTGYDMIIDGGSQTRQAGDTNPLGPEIVLDGSLSELPAAVSDGLTFRGTFNVCRDLVISGFPGNGINSGAVALTVRDSYIGVDATGRKALSNGRRGVKVFNGSLLLVHNVLSGNARAGAYIATDGDVGVYRNYIGVGADGVTPIGNGASGLFFHKNHIDYHSAGATGNVIAYNAHAGIALSLAAVGTFGENDFHDNAGQAIDIGMDGPTEHLDGYLGQGGVLAAPVITSAHYENGVTTIRASFDQGGNNGAHLYSYVELYASDRLDAGGEPEGQEWIGRFEIRGGEVECKVNGDLRGRYVSASTFGAYAYNFEDVAAGTSELGRALRVD